MGGIFKTIGKIAKIAIPVALTALTGGAAAPVTFGSIAAGIGKSLAINALTGAISGDGGKKSSPVTGQVAQASEASTTAAATSESADEIEKKKRLALNAAGSSGTTTSPLGVSGTATVTKRNLLGL